jgi:hypothetical protein
MFVDNTLKVEKQNYEIRDGISGSGKKVFFIYWKKKDGPFEIEGLYSPFRSRAEAVANAKCQIRCGKEIV